MTRPKRWYLAEDADKAVVLKNNDGLIKKPNAARPLGKVLTVTNGDREKYSEDTIEFQCSNGRIVLSLKYHQWNRSLIEEVVPPQDFISQVNHLVAVPVDTSSTSQPESNSQSGPSYSSESSPSTTHTSVKRRSQVSIQSPSKRCKHIKDTIDEDIERHKKGLYQVPVSQLVDPPRESRLLRETDEKFVKSLKSKMILDPSAPGATPMAVLCRDVSLSSFNEKHLNVYKYEVLGGLHSFRAKMELMKEFPTNPFYQEALAEVYLELSDEQALRLAQRHNTNSHFIHRITHRDLVESCRARLYRIARQDSSSETPAPTSEWKESCKRAIIPNNISATHQDTILHQAALPKGVWDLAVEVMNEFEKVNLKDQKQRITLNCKPEFKQYLLAPIRSLDASDQIFLLTRCKNKEISLAELKKEATALKQLALLKKTFVKLTNVADWNDAVKQFPLFADEPELKKFVALDFTKGTPQSFVDFCKRAKSSEDMVALCDGYAADQTFVQCGRVVGYAIKEKPSELSGSVISSVYPGFQGAELILTSIEQGCNTEDIENISYTIKEINTVAGLHTYTVVCVCQPEAFLALKDVWENVFTCVDVLFFADHQSQSRLGYSGTKLEKCVKAVVIGFQSIDDTITSAQFVFKEGESKLNFFAGNRAELCQYILSHFCPPGGTVLDMSCDPSGVMAVTAFSSEHNVVTVLCEDDTCADVLAKLSQVAS